MLVSVSILSSVYKAKDIVEKINKTTADFIHLDIMDGKFVENKTFTFNEIKKLVNFSNKKLDVHLMVKNPLKYIEDYALLNTEYITFHYESVNNHIDIINKIKESGLKVGISIKPKTDVSEIENILKYLDLVLIMGVEPGKSGQEFKESTLDKIEKLKQVIDENGYNTIISVDGGINDEVFKMVKEKGADMIVSASYLHEGDMEEKIKEFKV